MYFVHKADVKRRPGFHALKRLRGSHLDLGVGAEAPVLGHQHPVVDTGSVEVFGKLFDKHPALADENDLGALVLGSLDHLQHDHALASAGTGRQHLPTVTYAKALAQALDSVLLVLAFFNGHLLTF